MKVIPPNVMSFQKFRMWMRDRCMDDGVGYDEEDIWNQYNTYLDRQKESPEVIAMLNKDSRAGYFSFSAAFRHFFNLNALQCLKEITGMDLETRRWYANELRREGYINVGDPKQEMTSHQFPMLPHNVPVPVKQLSEPPAVPIPITDVSEDAGNGYILGDAHPTQEKAA